MKKKNFDDLQAPNSSLALSFTLLLFLLPARVMTNTPQNTSYPNNQRSIQELKKNTTK